MIEYWRNVNRLYKIPVKFDFGEALVSAELGFIPTELGLAVPYEINLFRPTLTDTYYFLFWAVHRGMFYPNA